MLLWFFTQSLALSGFPASQYFSVPRHEKKTFVCSAFIMNFQRRLFLKESSLVQFRSGHSQVVASIMRSSILFILVVGLNASAAMYTPKCKEAEKSNLHFMRILENMNCTLLMGQRKVQKGFENIHIKFKTGVDDMKSFLGFNKIEPVKEDKLDYDIDIRFLNERDDALKITKRDAEDEGKGIFCIQAPALFNFCCSHNILGRRRS